MIEDNPILSGTELPEFLKIRPEHVAEAIRHCISQNREAIEKAVSEHSDNPSWDNIVAPLELISEKLNRAWGIVSHLNNVLSSDELRAQHDAMVTELSEFSSWEGQHEGLYNCYRKIYDRSDLSPLQRRALDFSIKSFELSGIALPENEKKLFNELKSRLSQVTSNYANNVLDATQNWFFHTENAADLKGLPGFAMDLARQDAESRGLPGYVITLQYPSYLPVMKYAESRELRFKCYEAYVTRASALGPDQGKFNNDDIMKEKVSLNKRMAGLLGFRNYAERSLVLKMASSTDEVMNFLGELVSKCHDQGLREMQELSDYARSVGFTEKLEPWDLSYFSEKLRESRYAINDETVRPYFPLPKVIQGLFRLVSIIFGISIKQRDGVDVWHKDVSYYEIFDREGNKKGGFYLDPYARDNKQGGAWMDDCIGRWVHENGEITLPVAYIVTNFMPPIGGKPALLSHYEVETLFHEFGHALHHLLTEVDVPSLAGLGNVPWDAVETPSQFMENFTWNPEVLAMISGHVDTGEALPQDLLNKMIMAKNFQSALGMLRQLEFATFDFRLYRDYDENTDIHQLLCQVREDISVTPVAPFNRFENSFSHIFAGGYSAGYYSYLWAEVLSSDCFARFEEEGILNPEIGKEFMNTILAQGGSREFMDIFESFRGRKPSVDALLRHSGINCNDQK